MRFLLNQWSQIKLGGFPVLRRKLGTALRQMRNLLLFLVNTIWALPVVIVMRIVSPWVHVRTGTIQSNRIGHFVGDAAIFLASNTLQPENRRTLSIFWLSEPTCNEYWARIIRRKLYIRWWVRYIAYLNRLIPGGTYHDVSYPSNTVIRAAYAPLLQSSVRFEISVDEDEIARAWLRRRGWQDGDPFICLAVRDSAYLSSYPFIDAGPGYFNYHNYRDSDIDTYVEAIRYLVEQGYWVIRMGKIADKRLLFNHSKVIDYPFVDDQNDLIDIWLSINCLFFVSTATGIDTLAWVYGRPLVFVNALPFIGCPSLFQHIWVPKHLYWMDSGRPLSLTEHCQHGYAYSKDYEQRKIKIRDLSPSEITDAIIECEQRVVGKWQETNDDISRQLRFWKVCLGSPNFNKFHDYIHPEARVGSVWLKSMGDAFLN